MLHQNAKHFSKKMHDYGSAWRILRLSSLTDQIFIKAQRIRGLQKLIQKVDEGEADEFIGVINYSVMALIKLKRVFQKSQTLRVKNVCSFTIQ